MANQITIDIGAAANDGTGDPLRTAFNYVNNNFSNVWNTGLPNSNVQFSDNRILTVNTNANLVLAPNGIGKVASNVDIVPNTANVFSLGGTDRRWNTVYGQYLDLSHNATIGGNLVVTGNITGGNIHYTGNVFVGDLEGSVFDGASSLVLDVINSSIYVDNYYYANGAPISFGGNYSNANVAAYLPTYTGNISANNISAGNVFTAATVTATNIYAKTGSFSGDENTGDDALYVGSPTFTNLGTDIMAQFTGNVTNYGQINLQNWSNAATASGDYIITADNGNDSTKFLDLGMTSSTWDGSQTNVLDGLSPNNGYLYVQDGNLTLGVRNGSTSYTWKFDTAGNLTVAGNVVPTGNNIQSLGSPTQRWKDLWLFGNTIQLGDLSLSATASGLTSTGGFDLENSSAANIEATGNIAANNFIATEWVYGNIGVDTPQIQMNDGVSNSINLLNSSGSLIYESSAGNAGGFVPSSDNSETIGRSDARWGSMYANVFYGDLTVSSMITSAAVTTITAEDDVNIRGGNKVPGSDASEGGDINIFAGDGRIDSGVSAGSGGDVVIEGGIGGEGVSSSAGTGGDITLQAGLGGDANAGNAVQAGEGGRILIQGGDGGDNAGNNALSGIGGNVEIYGGSGSFDNANTIPNGAPGHVNLYGGNWGFNFAPTGNIYLNTYDGSNFKTLAYDYNGNVTMAAGGGLNFVGSNPGIVQSPDEDFRIRVQDANDDGFALLLQVDDGAGTVLGSTELQRDRFVVQFAGGGAPQFTFNENGEFSVPGNIRTTEYVDSSLYAVSDNSENGSVELKVISYAGDVLGSNVRVSQSNATISTGNAAHTWNFDNTGVLTFPGGANIVNGAFNGTASSTVSLNALSPDGNTVSFQAQGNTSSAVISIFSNAGPVTSNWTFTTAPLDPTESLLYIPNGGTISTPNATGGEGGKNIFIVAGASDPETWNSNPGGELMLKGGYGSFGDGGGGPGGNVNIEGGASSDSHAGNVNIASGGNTWVFDYTGNLTAPGNITGSIVQATNNDGTGRNIKVGDDTWLGDINISNTLSIRGQQDPANAYIVFGNASNVKLGRAGSGPLRYEGDFTANGNISAGNNFQLPVYADATARDAAITAPTAGMMIYVTGTGMQVRGATSWNTIAGSGT